MVEFTLRLLPFLTFIAALHPLVCIATQPYLGCKTEGASFYTSKNTLSIFCHNRLVIGFSIILFFVCLITFNCLFAIPILFIAWISFIRDRFKSLARGLGAPGYFSFLSILIASTAFCIFL